MANKRNIINAFAVLAIVICGAGLAGSLVEQITGSAVVEESATSAAEDAFSFEPTKTSNGTDANEVRFSIGQLMQPKICEISAVSIGMIVGIIALFSGIVERKGFYIASLVISFLDAMLSGGVFGFLIYLFLPMMKQDAGGVGEEESFNLFRWSILLPLLAMGLNIPLKLIIGFLSVSILQNFDEYSTS